MSRLKRCYIVEFSEPTGVTVLGDMEYTHTLPRLGRNTASYDLIDEALRSVESVIDKLNVFQTAVITNLEKFWYR